MGLLACKRDLLVVVRQGAGPPPWELSGFRLSVLLESVLCSGADEDTFVSPLTMVPELCLQYKPHLSSEWGQSSV